MFSCLFYYKQKGNIFLSPLDPLGCGCLLFLNKAAQIRERTKLFHFSCLIPAGTWKSPQWQQHLVLTCTLSFPHPQHLSQFLFPDVTHVFPEFPAPDLGNVLLQEGFTLNDVKTLQVLYRRHCEVIVCNILWGLFGIDLLTMWDIIHVTSSYPTLRKSWNIIRNSSFARNYNSNIVLDVVFSSCELFSVRLVTKTVPIPLFSMEMIDCEWQHWSWVLTPWCSLLSGHFGCGDESPVPVHREAVAILLESQGTP